ncbi:MAG TPA: methyltransferase domain-containing protein [Thermoanaerobaculia bacterium]|nr:methyltransferase domain-containing protein [Thermoanaerobaculia bacterium]
MANTPTIDNAFYDTLGDAWYNGENVAMSILRTEARFKNAWVEQEIERSLPHKKTLTVVDIGCGGGFLANHFAQRGHKVVGLDASLNSLRTATRHDGAGARYVQADAYRLPLDDASVSVVCAMDVLEHLDRPGELIAEIARILEPGGLFFFQTYNRTPLARFLFVWAVNRTPGAARHTHVYHLFIKPKELEAHCGARELSMKSMTGFKLGLNRASMKALVGNYKDVGDFRYELTRSLAAGYMGYAQKTG